MKTTTKKAETPLTFNLRDRLKAMMEREIERLPELLDGLEGKERLDVIVKLMPFVLPKIQSVQPNAGEPFTLDW